MRLILLAVLAGIALGFAGCASSDQQKDPDRVTSIPWNRPERWEGQGPFGGLMQGSR
jgi:hypothetical protein